MLESWISKEEDKIIRCLIRKLSPIPQMKVLKWNGQFFVPFFICKFHLHILYLNIIIYEICISKHENIISAFYLVVDLDIIM